MANTPKTCVYRGVFDLGIQTYTTTWPNMFGQAWAWNPNSPLPMEFRGFISGAVGVGMWLKILDVSTGITEIKIGNILQVNEDTAHFRYPLWQNNQIMGWFSAQPPNDQVAYPYSYPAVLGDSYTSTRAMSYLGAKLLPQGAPNTGFPFAYGPPNLPGPNNTVAYSSIINNVPNYYLAPGTATGTPNLDLSGSTSALGATLAFGNSIFATTANNAFPAAINRLMLTDWISFGIHYDMTWTNPPGTEDINSDIITALNNWRSTPLGFVQCFAASTNTIEGKQSPYGFAVVMSPDGSYYSIARFVPQDANAATLLNSIGLMEAKGDLSGGLWFKNANNHTTLLVSSGSVLKVLPIYFPVPIPDSADADPALRLMRSIIDAK